MFEQILLLLSEDQQNWDCSTHEFDCLQSPLTNGVYIHKYIWRRHLLKREFQDNKYTKMDYMDLKSNKNDDLFGLEIMPVNECEKAHAEKSKCS